MNRLFVLLFVATASLGLIGCGKDLTHARIATSPVLYRRVVSLSPSSTEIATRLGFVQIIGRTASCELPTAAKIPVVMNGVKPDYEKILALNPEAILYDHDLISEADLAKFAEMKIATIDTGGKPNTVKGFCDNLLDIGAITHGEKPLAEYVDRINSEIGAAKVNTVSPKPKVAILLGGSGAEHMIAGTNSFSADVVRQAQSEPVGPDAPNFVTLNAEWLKSADPDIIFVPGDVDSVQNDPRFKTLKAVVNRRVYRFAPEMIMRRGGRVESAIKNVNVAIYNLMNRK